MSCAPTAAIGRLTDQVTEPGAWLVLCVPTNFPERQAQYASRSEVFKRPGIRLFIVATNRQMPSVGPPSHLIGRRAAMFFIVIGLWSGIGAWLWTVNLYLGLLWFLGSLSLWGIVDDIKKENELREFIGTHPETVASPPDPQHEYHPPHVHV